LNGLQDGELLCVAITLEEQCMLMFREMHRAFEFTDPKRARFFLQLRDAEAEHRERLTALWVERGSPRVSGAEITPWLAERYPTIMELWDPDDEDPRRALAHVHAVEREAGKFLTAAASAARDVRIKKLLQELAVEEAAHRNDAGEPGDEH
jgi:rubrerythrin